MHDRHPPVPPACLPLVAAAVPRGRGALSPSRSRLFAHCTCHITSGSIPNFCCRVSGAFSPFSGLPPPPGSAGCWETGPRPCRLRWNGPAPQPPPNFAWPPELPPLSPASLGSSMKAASGSTKTLESAAHSPCPPLQAAAAAAAAGLAPGLCSVLARPFQRRASRETAAAPSHG